MAPTLLITRPAPQDAQFADQLRVRVGCNVPVILSPVLCIEATGAAVDPNGVEALIVTSRHALEHIPQTDLPVWLVGPKLAELAEDKGLRVAHVAEDGTALAAAIGVESPGAPLLHVRGDHVALDLAGDLRAGGIACEDVVVYRQVAQPLSAAARSALTGESPVVLPLFSPRSAALVFDGGHITAPVVVAALSDAVAGKVPRGAARDIIVAQRPRMAAMLDATATALDTAKRLEGQNRAQ